MFASPPRYPGWGLRGQYAATKLQNMAQAGMSVHENFRKVLTLWYENLRSVLAVPSGRIGRAV